MIVVSRVETITIFRRGKKYDKLQLYRRNGIMIKDEKEKKIYSYTHCKGFEERIRPGATGVDAQSCRSSLSDNRRGAPLGLSNLSFSLSVYHPYNTLACILYYHHLGFSPTCSVLGRPFSRRVLLYAYTHKHIGQYIIYYYNMTANFSKRASFNGPYDTISLEWHRSLSLYICSTREPLTISPFRRFASFFSIFLFHYFVQIYSLLF